MSQVEQIGKTISDSINPKARVAFGITQNKKEGIKITLLANGCKWGEWEKGKEKPKKKVKAKKKPPELVKVPQPERPQILVEGKSKEVKGLSQTSKSREKVKIKVKRTALDLNRIAREEEEKRLAEEKKWEISAFLRQIRENSE